MFAAIRKYFISGLLVWLPIWVTLLILNFLVGLMDKIFMLLPAKYQPDNLLGFHIPGLGLLFTLIILFLTGMLVTNFLGWKLVSLWDNIVGRIPIVRSIYKGVKKVLETVVSPQGQAFRKVLLVEYPREGLWSIAFQTGHGSEEVNTKTEKEMVTIFIPTTPNPTSGFLMMLPKEHVYELDMSVEEALKFVISLGVVQPGMAKETNKIKQRQQ